MKDHNSDIYEMSIESYELLIQNGGIEIKTQNYYGYLRAIETLT